MSKFHKHRTLDFSFWADCPIFGILTLYTILHRFIIVKKVTPPQDFAVHYLDRNITIENMTVILLGGGDINDFFFDSKGERPISGLVFGADSENHNDFF